MVTSVIPGELGSNAWHSPGGHEWALSGRPRLLPWAVCSSLPALADPPEPAVSLYKALVRDSVLWGEESSSTRQTRMY